MKALGDWSRLIHSVRRSTLVLAEADPDLIGNGLAALSTVDGHGAIGSATDSGWWALGLRDPRRVGLLTDVPTSRSDTGARTLAALRTGGLRVDLLPF